MNIIVYFITSLLFAVGWTESRSINPLSVRLDGNDGIEPLEGLSELFADIIEFTPGLEDNKHEAKVKSTPKPTIDYSNRKPAIEEEIKKVNAYTVCTSDGLTCDKDPPGQQVSRTTDSSAIENNDSSTNILENVASEKEMIEELDQSTVQPFQEITVTGDSSAAENNDSSTDTPEEVDAEKEILEDIDQSTELPIEEVNVTESNSDSSGDENNVSSTDMPPENVSPENEITEEPTQATVQPVDDLAVTKSIGRNTLKTTTKVEEEEQYIDNANDDNEEDDDNGNGNAYDNVNHEYTTTPSTTTEQDFEVEGLNPVDGSKQAGSTVTVKNIITIQGITKIPITNKAREDKALQNNSTKHKPEHPNTKTQSNKENSPSQKKFLSHKHLDQKGHYKDSDENDSDSDSDTDSSEERKDNTKSEEDKSD